MKNRNDIVPRRKFLKETAAAVAFSSLASDKILGANDRIRLGAIGVGGRSRKTLIPIHQNQPDTEFAAVCDVYEPHLLRTVSEDGLQNVKQARDYRAILDDKGIDAVIIGAPDHWHARMVSDAVAAGKDVYVEKPVTHTLEEGNDLIRAVESSKQIVQTGTQQRSWPHFILDCVKSRKTPTANIRVAVEAARAAHLGNLALKEERRIKWNAQQERIER